MKTNFKEVIFFLLINFLAVMFFMTTADGAEFDLSVGGMLNYGNSDLRQLNGVLGLKHNSGVQELSMNINYDYGWIKGEQSINKGRLTGVYDRLFNSTLSTFFFITPEFDEAKNIDLKLSGGAGLKYKYTAAFSVSGAPLVEYMQADKKTYKIRFSLRPKVKFKYFNAVLFYKPNVNDFADYLIESMFIFKMNLKLALTDITMFELPILKITIRDEYNNISSGNIKKNDLSVINSFMWQW